MEGLTRPQRAGAGTLLLLLGSMLCASLLVVTGGSIQPAAAASSPARIVGTDPAGDWNAYLPEGGRGVGHDLGQDLVKASIRARGRFIDFTIHVTKLALVDAGAAAAPTGYFWDFRVGRPGGYGSTSYEISSCEVDRDPCPESAPDPAGNKLPFLVYRCNWIFSLGGGVGCEKLGSVAAARDVDAATITVSVPRVLIGADAGMQITGEDVFGAALFSYTMIPVTGTELDPHEPFFGDSLKTKRVFVVPGR